MFIRYIMLSMFLVNVLSYRKRTMYKKGVSDEEMLEIIDLHNKYRHQLVMGEVFGQPKAKHINRISPLPYYKMDSADYAANMCDYNFEDRGKYYPLSLYYENYENLTDLQMDSDWNKVLNEWFQQHASYKYPFSTSNTQEYERMIGAHVTGVACGYAVCYVEDEGDYNYYSKYYVCIYELDKNYEHIPYEAEPDTMIKPVHS